MDFCKVVKLCYTSLVPRPCPAFRRFRTASVTLNAFASVRNKGMFEVKIDYYYVENVTWKVVRAGGCPVVVAQW